MKVEAWASVAAVFNRLGQSGMGAWRLKTAATSRRWISALGNSGALWQFPVMSPLALDLQTTLKQLDPDSASKLERLVRDAMDLAQPSKSKSGSVDAKGWPIGHFEKFAGCLETEYGRFPDKVTALEIQPKTGTPLTLSDRTSNDVFIQLLASGIGGSETYFATYSSDTRKPDGDWSSDATALEHGETSFAFVSGLSTKGNPSCPIVFGPVIPGTKILDAKSFDGKAVLLKLDNSVTSRPIDSEGRIMINGFDLLDPKNPIWNGKAPDIKWPK